MRHVLTLLLLLLTMAVAAEEKMRPSMNCRRTLPVVRQQSRRAITRASARVGGDFYHGERRQLTVLVSFNDQQFTEQDPVPTWNRIFNAENYTEPPFKGSVHDYFYAQSYGQFEVAFDLCYLSLAHDRSRYRSTSVEDENSQYLVADIVELLRNMDMDWSQYDWDGDGYVNQLLIVFAGKGSSYGNFGGGYDAIWPHQSLLSEHIDPATGSNCLPCVVTDRYGVEYMIDSYCAVQELDTDGSYGIFGTICHEYTHCFGFPDLYAGKLALGAWDLMASGNYNGSGFCPAGFSAHERWLMGWITPEELSAPASIIGMPMLDTNAAAYLIRNDAYADEYYVVENRQQSGWDASLPGSGLLVFHIDYDAEAWYTNNTNTGTQDRYTIFRASNGSGGTSSWPYPYKGNNQLTDTSQPAATLNHANASGTWRMGKPLTNMAVADGLASFDFMGGQTAIQSPSSGLHPRLLYDFGPVRIVRMPNGDIKKVMKR